jgi:hypothetical protein
LKQRELFGRNVEAAQFRQQLLKRLDEEDATDLSDRLRKCGLLMPLWCRECGHKHEAHTKCNRKWCPSCAPKRGNERAQKLRKVIKTMQWPLHITFTVPNVQMDHAPRSLLRDLMQSFGRLRRLKIWKTNVKGGVVAVEITDKGRGLHPHLHVVCDARWIALSTPAPSGRESGTELREKLKSAAAELQAAWQFSTGLEQHLQIYVRRCDAGAANEIVKYALKSEDVINCTGEIAPILRMLDSIRAVRTWGSCHGLKFDEKPDHPLLCPLGHKDWSTVPSGPGHEVDNRSRALRLAEQRAAEFELRMEKVMAAEAEFQL